MIEPKKYVGVPFGRFCDLVLEHGLRGKGSTLADAEYCLFPEWEEAWLGSDEGMPVRQGGALRRSRLRRTLVRSYVNDSPCDIAMTPGANRSVSIRLAFPNGESMSVPAWESDKELAAYIESAGELCEAVTRA